VKSATRFPGLRNLARSLDEAFGYGKIYSTAAHKRWWKAIDKRNDTSQIKDRLPAAIWT
jgi:hypothetical protein